MTPSQIFLYFCLSFIGGIFLNSVFEITQLILLGILIFGIILISVFWGYPIGKPSVSNGAGRKFVIVGFCILFLVLGTWRQQIAELAITNSELRKLNDLKQNITLIGIVSDEPDIKEKIIKLKIEDLKLEINGDWKEISGKVLLTANRYPEYQYGDKLKITGLLKTPSEDIDGFNYKKYLHKDGIYSIMDWPKIELIGQNFGNPVYRILFSFKNKFQETARNFIPPPQEGILEALIFGQEQNISKEWKDKLNFTGTRHIAAVSGMNITIIASLILNFLLLLGFWRQQAFYLAIFLLLFYILMIGAPASAVRAGIMGIILMAATYFGRLSSAHRAVTFAAFLMVFFNPLLLRFDVGFQLSFLAILGIVFLQPYFMNWLKISPNPQFFPLRTTLATTLSAQVFTMPVLIYNFGYIPLISPITNVLIVPFLAPITILIFIFGLAGMILQPFGFLLSLPTWLSLTYIIGVIDWFSKIPFASLVIKNTHWIWLVISYLILGLITWRLQESQKLRFLKY